MSSLNFTHKKVYLACGPTDMRKSIDGLCAIVEAGLGLDPVSSDAVFVFCNRGRNRVKILEWDQDGFWVYFKRLENTRIDWPQEQDAEKAMQFSSRELTHLLEATKIEQKIRRKKLFPNR